MTRDEMTGIVLQCSFPGLSIQICGDESKTYLQVHCLDGVNNVTGAKGHHWSGRKWLLSEHMTETEVVKTALVAVKQAIEHEVLELFTYQGLTIFNPHISVLALMAARTYHELDARDPILRSTL
jgi:hypothetical protein